MAGFPCRGDRRRFLRRRSRERAFAKVACATLAVHAFRSHMSRIRFFAGLVGFHFVAMGSSSIEGWGVQWFCKMEASEHYRSDEKLTGEKRSTASECVRVDGFGKTLGHRLDAGGSNSNLAGKWTGFTSQRKWPPMGSSGTRSSCGIIAASLAWAQKL